LIICDYDNNTLEIKSPVIKKFVSEMKKISNIDFVDNNFFLVGEGVKAMNKIECEKTGFSNELIEGSIVQKGKEFFFLRQKRRNKKEKFFLTFQTNFFEKTLKLPSCSIDSVRIIG